jgi:hypothetical protein
VGRAEGRDAGPTCDTGLTLVENRRYINRKGDAKLGWRLERIATGSMNR